ncbi:peptide deformylase [Micromonospora cathayae]|uniref:Peptide deformylase n=1 Tax=Micromonospora cathayae TaxID=3028804 RepID=A0ABY7ZJF0_9ACTN|nr:peptide deformylase [Micromonospora sp. HUAS 3]WDZ83080.1 peptide deformylase [Micromonospora sp. HUAS 3]
MELDDATREAVAAFVAELRHRREVAGLSQKALAKLVGYTPSYVSKVEGGVLLPSREFAEGADQSLQAGRAIVHRWQDLHTTHLAATTAPAPRHGPAVGDPQSWPGTEVVVEHEMARLTYRDGAFHTEVRRQLHNRGDQPVTRYLIRISVDRFPGDPAASNAYYREDPLTMAETRLAAYCLDERMDHHVQHDRDAFKEIWLLFENGGRRFPLYPGDRRWITYSYSVPERKWGPWWQRAIRLPTRRLTLALDFPAALRPVVWGLRSSMSAEPSPFPRDFSRDDRGDRVVFGWSTENPPLHARYRIEWTFKAAPRRGDRSDEDMPTPSQRMIELGIAQEGAPVLGERAAPFALPDEADDARRVVAHLLATMARVAAVHLFAKGMGLAAPQVGIGRSAAVVRTPDGTELVLLNPRVIDESRETDEQYEGCLSFFDVRGLVRRPVRIEVAHQEVDGQTVITEFRDGLARLVAHEIDHLEGRLYRDRMPPGAELVPVSRYRGTGTSWSYRTSDRTDRPG